MCGNCGEEQCGISHFCEVCAFAEGDGNILCEDCATETTCDMPPDMPSELEGEDKKLVRACNYNFGAPVSATRPSSCLHHTVSSWLTPMKPSAAVIAARHVEFAIGHLAHNHRSNMVKNANNHLSHVRAKKYPVRCQDGQISLKHVRQNLKAAP